MKRTGLVASLLLLAACSGEPLADPKAAPHGSSSAPVVSAVPAPPPTPPAFRLPDGVAPTRASATLTLVPTEDTFKGTGEIELTVTKPTRVLWLHATELTVSEAHLEVAGQKRAARVLTGDAHFVGFAFDEDIPAGPARLSTTFTGKVSSSDDRGVFREKEGADTYLFSQFENVDARRAFPCFDEPSFKIPWQITLRVKPTDTALSNTPVTSETLDADGWKTVRFAETKALPSYLVAFAVGPFEMVDAGKSSKSKTPIRFAVPRGKSAEAAFAAGAAPKVLDLLEDAFGVPYPFEKLDYVVIPSLASFGAMENAGLITMAGYATLATKGEDTIRQRQMSVAFMAHESAHQWFGDLVTMAWWDDVWLNEGFATWMERKISQQYDASYGTELGVIEDTAGTMSGDALLSARKIRQEVVSYDDISNAFDGITYQKGGAVLGMFEAWLGWPTFQKGVRLYLDRFGRKNATSNDFLTAMSEAAGKDVRAPFSSFLDQPGVPLVTTTLKCDAKGAKLELAQERALPIGSKGSATAATWQIPVCVRYGAGKQSGRACSLLTEKTGEMPLPKLEGQKGTCPDWVTPKDGGKGYYRSFYTPKDAATLLDKKTPVTSGERLSAVLDVRSLASVGRFPLGDALARIPELLKDPDPRTAAAATGMLGWLTDDFVPAELTPNVKRFIGKTLAPRARALGWQAKAADSTGLRKQRFQMLEVMIDLGDDPKLFDEADALAKKWLDDPDALEGDSVDTILRAAGSRGDKKLFDRVVQMIKTEADTRRRDRLVGMLGAFRDPALVKAGLSIFLDPAMDPRVGMGLFWGQRHGNLRVEWDFVKEHFDAIMARAPAEMRAYIIGGATDFCDEKSRAEVESFLKDRVATITGAPRMLAQSLEGISLCIAKRDAHADNLRAFLKKQ